MTTDLGRDFVSTLTGFGRELREVGLPVGTGEIMTYAATAALLEPADLVDLYWAGRTTLVTRREQIPAYDLVFRRYYLDEPGSDQPEQHSVEQRAEAAATLQLPDPEAIEDPDSPDQDREARMGLMASAATTMRHRAFGECTDEELAAIRRLMRRMRLVPPTRRSRRTQPAKRGPAPDLRRLAVDAMRHHGEIGRLSWRTHRRRTRPLVLVLDVSGSMADYSRALLQFAHGTIRSARSAQRVEVFCFGTRLTRITHQLARRRPDDALRAAAERVVDWEGGTLVGESLQTFVRGFGRRGMSRGSIVVICSDGLDRGSPAVLDEAMTRLSRLCHRIVWVTPQPLAPGEVPATLGMAVAAPYVDVLLPGHDLASLEKLALVLPGLR